MGSKGATHVNLNNTDTQGDTGRPTNTTLPRPDEDTCTNLQVHGFVAHRKNIAQLDKIPMEAKRGSGTPPGFERLLHNSINEIGGNR